MNLPNYRHLPGVHRSPNIQGDAAIYEFENEAADQGHLIEAAMRAIAPWDGRVVLDLGAGTGFHLARFYADAQHLFAVEPHDASRLRIFQRIVELGMDNVSVVKGSAEYIPLRDQSIEICHARFAYFFAPDCEPGLIELRRVMRPGGTVFIIDNDLTGGTFARWMESAGYGTPADTLAAEEFWARHGFAYQVIKSDWQFRQRSDLEAVVNLEFGEDHGAILLADHEGLSVSYHYRLYYRTY